MQVVPPPPPLTWEQLWDQTWQYTLKFYTIQATSTVLHDPVCQGDLGIHGLVKNTITAVAMKKYGDAVRFNGQFQSKLMCLSRTGVRGVEYALSSFVTRAIWELLPSETIIAVHGVINLGMLTFDQLKYTQRSWWMPVMAFHLRPLGPIMKNYPRYELGLWMHDEIANRLVRADHIEDIDRLIISMDRVESYGDFRCSLLNMSRNGFTCPQNGQYGSGGDRKPGSGGTPGLSGVIAPNGVSCVLAQANDSGMRGEMRCISRALSGIRPSPFTTPSQLLNPPLSLSGIRDKLCALSEGDSTTTDNNEEKKPEGIAKVVKNLKDKVAETAQALADKAKEITDFIERSRQEIKERWTAFRRFPPGIAEMSQAASEEGANAEAGGKNYADEIQRKRDLANSGNIDKYMDDRQKTKPTDPGSYHRTMQDIGGASGGGAGCGDGTNAAARAKALYQCAVGGASLIPTQAWRPPSQTSGGEKLSAEPSTGSLKGGVLKDGFPTQRPPSGSQPTPPIGNPNIARYDPEQQMAKMPAAMACAVQGGDMPRMSMNDSQCAAMRCVEGAVCPCNRTVGFGGNQMQRRPIGGATPDCMGDEPCLQKPKNPGTVPVPPRGGGDPVPGQGPGGGPPGVK